MVVVVVAAAKEVRTTSCEVVAANSARGNGQSTIGLKFEHLLVSGGDGRYFSRARQGTRSSPPETGSFAFDAVQG